MGIVQFQRDNREYERRVYADIFPSNFAFYKQINITQTGYAYKAQGATCRYEFVTVHSAEMNNFQEFRTSRLQVTS